jgi:AcrR family transcriptional regulator
MARTEPDKRTRLIETATKLAYRRGFRQTSLADIAEAANAPVGNVYYYFKTKDELGEAFVEERLAEFRALRDQINRLGSPEGAAACVRGRHSTAQGPTCARRMSPGRPLLRGAQGRRRSCKAFRGALHRADGLA